MQFYFRFTCIYPPGSKCFKLNQLSLAYGDIRFAACPRRTIFKLIRGWRIHNSNASKKMKSVFNRVATELKNLEKSDIFLRFSFKKDNLLNFAISQVFNSFLVKEVKGNVPKCSNYLLQNLLTTINNCICFTGGTLHKFWPTCGYAFVYSLNWHQHGLRFFDNFLKIIQRLK